LTGLIKALAPDLSRAQIVNRFSEQRAGLRVLLVDELLGEFTGTVSISSQADPDGVTRRLFGLDVARRFRHIGLGTLLVRNVERSVLADGHSTIRLEKEVHNLVA
jgi:ribosomal protein S18 acetylase RimI-like enzyme